MRTRTPVMADGYLQKDSDPAPGPLLQSWPREGGNLLRPQETAELPESAPGSLQEDSPAWLTEGLVCLTHSQGSIPLGPWE